MKNIELAYFPLDSFSIMMLCTQVNMMYVLLL